MSRERSRSATTELVEFATGLRLSDLPHNVIDTSRDIILDSIGCALPGQLVEKGSIPIAIARAQGGTSQSTILGTAEKTSTSMASFVNGELINALDFDAILAPGHITPYVVPPALGFSELRDASGADLILAVAVAHEIGCRVSNALDGLRQLRGRPPKLQLSPASGYGSTIIGAVAGAGVALGFDRDVMANAIGLAGYAAPVPSLTKYLRAPRSFHAKYTSAGVVAQAASMSALMAAEGYLGDTTVLDGRYGFWRMYASSSCDWDFMLNDLGHEWRMLRVEIKPYPAFRMSHAALDALQSMVALEGFDPEEITKISVTADPISLNSCYVNRDLTNHTDAQLSWPFLVAAAAFYPPGIAWQTDALADPRVARLMERVEMVPSTAWARELNQLQATDNADERFPVWQRSEVEVEIGGRVLRGQLEKQTKGHPDNPMTRDDIDTKFLQNAAVTLGEQGATDALALLLDLEKAPSLTPILEKLASA